MRLPKRVLLTSGLLAGAVGAAGAVAFLAFLGYAPGRAVYPVQGIDVSHHQGAIDWAAVSSSGVDFVYMKATEGGDFKDRRFASNWLEAGQAGMIRGAYHFFTLCRPGRAQAANFIESVPVEPGSLPPAVDLEFGGNCSRRPNDAELAMELEDFLDLVERHFGREPILYATKAFHDRYLAGRFDGYRLWLRSLVFEPDYAERRWLFWQFHNLGRRPGIDSPVDLNVFRHGPEELAALLAAGDRAPEDP